MQVVLNSNILLLAVTPQIFFFYPVCYFLAVKQRERKLIYFNFHYATVQIRNDCFMTEDCQPTDVVYVSTEFTRN